MDRYENGIMSRLAPKNRKEGSALVKQVPRTRVRVVKVNDTREAKGQDVEKKTGRPLGRENIQGTKKRIARQENLCPVFFGGVNTPGG